MARSPVTSRTSGGSPATDHPDPRDVAERPLRILHAIHDFLPRHRAGSEIYTARLCRALADRHHVTVLCADYDPTRPHGLVTWRLHDGLPVVEIVNNWVCDGFADTYRPPLVSERIASVLDAVQPHVVHVHNLLNLSFDLPALARERNIPVVATLHDHTLVCASGGQRVHRAEQYVCHAIDPDRCARCFGESPFHPQMVVASLTKPVAASNLFRTVASTARAVAPRLVLSAARTAAAARRPAVTGADIRQRLSAARAVFDAVSLFVAPSPSIAATFVELGLDPVKIRVSDYGFEPSLQAGSEVVPSEQENRARPLRIGYVGTLVWHKGVHVLLEAARRLPIDAYEILVHGQLDVFPDYVADLRRAAEGLPVRFLGGFDAARAHDVYARMDVLVVPSIWLENSPLVIHEAFMAGVPVVGARIGGIADLITDGRNGRLYDAHSPEALADALRPLLADRTPLAAWASALPAVKTIADDAREWEETYRALTSRPGARVATT